ncbi:MAG TPA: ABC-three component system protein [Candidatus Cryosericum sp.]
MDDLAKDWFRTKFDRMAREKIGTEYQDFFADVMEQCYPNGEFGRVRPWGNEGDQKCDGYLVSTQTVFQVYAPNELTEAETIHKIHTDFDGAVEHWPDELKQWIFVHNSFPGLSANVEHEINGLRTHYPTITISTWSPADLQAHVFRLSQSKIETLLGFPPTREGMSNLDFEMVQSILDHIAKMIPTPSSDLRPVPADKIQINCLSSCAQTLLQAGMQQVKQVEMCLNLDQDPLYGDKLAVAFTARYQALRLQGLLPDDVLTELQKFAGGPDILSTQRSCGILAVIAYLFERCDIFERTSHLSANQ